MDFISPLVGGAMGIAQTAFNNWLGAESAEKSRERNFYYNEQAAINADVRQRRMYKDFYSPQALIKQYKEAGLSPSMMFGGTPGQGGASGNMSAGAAGIQNPVMPYSFLESAEAANLIAQTQKTKAETKNIEKQTDLNTLEEKLKDFQLIQYTTEWDLTNATWSVDGKETSLFELANDYYTYEGFLDAIRRSDQTDENLKRETTTEAGQKILRDIYQNASRFNRDIMVLSEENVNASFQIEVLQKLQDENFASLNAKTACQELRAMQATAELTTTQKEAWNNLIDKLGKKGSTTRDIIVVLGMILSNFASHTGIKVNVGK